MRVWNLGVSMASMKAIIRVLVYGVFVVVVVLLVLRTVGRPPEVYQGPVSLGTVQQGNGPVAKVSAHPSPTHPPFVAPTPFARRFASTDVDRLNALATAGDADARCELGIRYELGKGITRDKQAARALYQLAASQKNACGINALGSLADDRGDDVTAASYFHAAADMGYPASFYNLGQLAKWGTPPDEVAALRWYKEAALRGYTPAYDLVGTGVLLTGSEDPWVAEQWYLLGAKAGDGFAMYDLGWFYVYRSNEPDRYRNAIVWFKKSTCECPGAYEIGRLYAKGLGVPKDIKEAARWYKRSADQGHAVAKVAYADLLRRGLAGSAPSPAAALPYYEAAAADGNGDAMYALADMTERGIAVKRDPKKAELMYVAAAAHCSGDALFRLAQLRATGTAYGPKDVEQAVALAMLSATCGEDHAQTEALLKNIAPSVKDGQKVNQYYARFKAAIYDYTGDANFEPQNPLPPDVGGRGPTI